MWNLFESPRRGITQLVLALLLSAFYFFGNPQPRHTMALSPFRERRPSIFDQFQSGNPDDFAVLFALGLIIWIIYAIAVTIVDYRTTGRIW